MRHAESALQKAAVYWFRMQYPQLARMLFSIPNGGWRSPVEAAIMKAEGVVPGVADLILLIPNANHNCLCIEMKTAKGRQSEYQKEWEKDTLKHGNDYAVVRSFEEFKQLIYEYMTDQR